eukprot:2308785-Pleurochrysis_carterae.AAC.1
MGAHTHVAHEICRQALLHTLWSTCVAGATYGHDVSVDWAICRRASVRRTFWIINRHQRDCFSTVYLCEHVHVHTRTHAAACLHARSPEWTFCGFADPLAGQTRVVTARAHALRVLPKPFARAPSHGQQRRIKL